MNNQKPITRLKRLLGLSSSEEVAEIFELKKTTADNLNTGRAARNLTKAYQVICHLLERTPWKERHAMLPKKKKDLSQAEKAIRIVFLKERIESLPASIEGNVERAQDQLTLLRNYKEELAQL